MNPDIAVLSARVLAGDPLAVARAVSIVEDAGSAGRDLVGRIFARSGRAYVIGVTGAPGTGKSTLVDRLIGAARREQRTVGVIAVDPTSPFTGGAVLGDRVRMAGHAGDAGVFIRSMATRGHLGGLSRATADAVTVLDAAGFGLVFVETVGVGQDEVDIVATADVSIVLLVPGTGDDLQAMKAGVMEIADLFVVNKADREGADRVAQEITGSLALRSYEPDEWKPPVIQVEATSGRGVDVLWSEIERFRRWAAPRRGERRRQHDRARLRALLVEEFLRRVDAAVPADQLEQMVDSIGAYERDPYSAARAIMERVLPGSAGDELQ
jgi:LAO/AO transport system kinase